MTPIRGVILDVDGTLVDSNDAHAQAWLEALAEHGLHPAFDQVRGLIGMGGDKLLPRVSGIEEESPQGQALSKRRREIFNERYLPHLHAFPRTEQLLQLMHSRGLKLAVGSSAKKDELAPLLKLCGADGLVEAQTSADDVDRSKPDPDIVQAVLESLGVRAGEAVMLGDTPYDVAAARQAGVAVVAFRCGGWDDAGLTGAVAVYDGPADLLQHYDESPLARGIGRRHTVASDVDALYRALWQRAESYGISVAEARLGKDKAGKFDGPSITINTDTDREERAYFLAHSIGSVVRWALAAEESGAIYAELRQAKKRKHEEPERFERALKGFGTFEEATSEHAIWLLADLGFADAVAPYTAFARADLDAMVEFHRTGTAPTWGEFFAHWKEKVARGGMGVRPYQPRPIPPFRPVKIETQEIVQEKE